MLRILEFLTSFYWPLLLEIAWGTVRRTNWSRAYALHGPVGLFVETTESLMGTNTVIFFVPLTGKWDGYSISRLLKQYGIDMWGWGFWGQELIFHVRQSDARDAQDILLFAGVELCG